MDRERYHPIPIGADLLRPNNFEFVVSGHKPIQLMCKSAQFITPVTNAVPVPWASGIMSLAGRITSAYTFTITCIVGLESQYNAWEDLYNWRQKVFDHESGRIALASEYKLEASLLVYDITAENKKVELQMKGVWPSQVENVTFAVDQDGPVEVTATFYADLVKINAFS
jgi:hypothetical protein